jgi:hypothetical protein
MGLPLLDTTFVLYLQEVTGLLDVESVKAALVQYPRQSCLPQPNKTEDKIAERR